LALHDVLALDEAVQAALTSVDLNDTLIIVTADHSHVFNLAGYPQRGNPILGKVKNPYSDEYAHARDGLPYTTVGYLNGGRALPDKIKPCSTKDCDVPAHRSDLTHIDTTTSDYVHETLVPLHSETHSGEDVAIFAAGPWAHLFHGTHEQNYIYHVMRHAVGIQ
jgi:alkaline phosphatase